LAHSTSWLSSCCAIFEPQLSAKVKMHPFHRRKTLSEDRAKRRIHKIVPWIQNPLQGVDKEHLLFAPRHEASTLELFFDLFL